MVVSTVMTKAGSFAPIGLQTSLVAAMAASGTAGVKGPVIDCNPVFDSAFTLGNPPATMGLAVTPDAVSTVTSNPGGAYTVAWAFTFTGFAAGEFVQAPYRIKLALGGNGARAAPLAGASGANSWEKYPVTYEGWTWGTSCTNTQFGKTPETAETPTPTMVNKTPTCAVDSDGNMVIDIVDEDLTSADWANFIMKFDIMITNPSNIIGTTTIDYSLV